MIKAHLLMTGVEGMEMMIMEIVEVEAARKMMEVIEGLGQIKNV